MQPTPAVNPSRDWRSEVGAPETSQPAAYTNALLATIGSRHNQKKLDPGPG